MTNCTHETTDLQPRRRCLVEVCFDGGHVTGIGDALLLRQADQMLGLLAASAARLPDGR